MSTGNTNFQDFTPLIIHKDKTKKEKVRAGEIETVRRDTKNKDTTKILSNADANNFDPENIKKPPTANLNIKTALQTARRNKNNMKQDELDKLCNLPKNTTKSYEDGTAILNSAHLVKMARALGVKSLTHE
jgi:ribosome-binding protein aMBF1 (putative translation factor)